MRNIKLTIAYDGTDYKGWQKQKNGPSVQQEIEKALKALFKKTFKVQGASRTDSGVHAKGQAAHFVINQDIPVRNIPHALNRMLPQDIVVVAAEEESGEFHSRFDARSKIYRYHILNSDVPDPFQEKYSWRIPYRLNISLMQKEAKGFEGRHDFRSFQASDKKERTSVRNIFYVEIRKKGPSVIIEIEGDGFLYNMVRNIVGTLVDVGRGYLPAGSIKKILAKKDRTSAGPTAPAKGLFLMEVKY
ncbi:MAG: tRNA pseudouridine(38-40) synthase TruA [Candidatus Omnitrophota bacterium]|nr:tRNA pseudouridine(38-40) synthase TruA [Candidatus Omnitrophota bacterium]